MMLERLRQRCESIGMSFDGCRGYKISLACAALLPSPIGGADLEKWRGERSNILYGRFEFNLSI